MRKTLILAAAALALLASPARAQQVTYDYDRHADFTVLRTYAWAPGVPSGDPMTDQRIATAIEAQLAASGLRPAAPGIEPDVRVAFFAGVGRRTEVTGSTTGWGGWAGAGSRSGYARTRQVYSGALAIEMVDGRTGRPLWHGAVARELDPGASPEERDRNVNKAMEKLFKHYPTRAKK